MTNDAGKSVFPSNYVNGGRLWKRHLDMNRLGATAGGGVCRLALSSEDHEARLLLARWASELELDVSIDPIGNMFVRREGTDPNAPPVITGSHLDTQPTGGRFDGIFGVLAGLEALQAIIDARIKTRHPIEVVSWTNEEGARFAPGYTGSSAYRSPTKLDSLLAINDSEGISIRHALGAGDKILSAVRKRKLGGHVAAYVEAHIEQGPVLEEAGNVIGVVTGIQGTRRFEVQVLGNEAHAGTTPRLARRDALSAAIAMIANLESLFSDEHDTMRFTVGRLNVHPNASSVVPSEVRFSIDLRHPDDRAITQFGDQVSSVCAAHRRQCTVEVTEISRTQSTVFPMEIVGRIEDASHRLGIPNMRLMSGAGHDALNLFHLAPTGMIFIPCEKGISHNEKENAKIEDLIAGTRVLSDVIVDLAR